MTVIDAHDFMARYYQKSIEEQKDREAYALGYALGSGQITMDEVQTWSPRVPLPPPTAINGRVPPKRDPDEAVNNFWRKVI